MDHAGGNAGVLVYFQSAGVKLADAPEDTHHGQALMVRTECHIGAEVAELPQQPRIEIARRTANPVLGVALLARHMTSANKTGDKAKNDSYELSNRESSNSDKQ
eukprot:1157817-Amphidinium_carterae.1